MSESTQNQLQSSSYLRTDSTAPTLVQFMGSTIAVPPPIYLRTACHPLNTSKGSISIRLPPWRVLFVRTPCPSEEPDVQQNIEPPSDDTVLSGVVEINMKERRRIQAISVGVQCVCRLYMGSTRGWEEDGIFERGVEIVGEQGSLWLEAGTQTFSFSIILPATLATTDRHLFGRVSYLLTARIEGIEPTQSLTRVFRPAHVTTPVIGADIPHREDFEAVIARSNKLERDLGRLQGGGDNGQLPPGLVAAGCLVSASASDPNPRLDGLFLQSTLVGGTIIPVEDNLGGVHVIGGKWIAQACEPAKKEAAETPKWLRGDMAISRDLCIHSNIASRGGLAKVLDVFRQGFDEGLGVWQLSASSDCFAIGGALALQLSFVEPLPGCRIHAITVDAVQQYFIFSPRTPTEPPRSDEYPHVESLYRLGASPRSDTDPDLSILPALYEAPDQGAPSSWRTTATVRVPTHETFSPSTSEGSITPIRVVHNFIARVTYSHAASPATARTIRTAELRFETRVPSCWCHSRILEVPAYEEAPLEAAADVQEKCLCEYPFELLKADLEMSIKRSQAEPAAPTSFKFLLGSDQPPAPAAAPVR